MGIRSWLAENKQARQEAKQVPSWWKRKKNTHDDVPTQSWGGQSATLTNPAPSDTIIVPNPDGVEPGWALPFIKEALAEEISRYDTVPSYEIPHMMIALKGAPTDNVGRYLEWKGKQ